VHNNNNNNNNNNNMAVSGTLHTYPNNYNANKILIAAAYSGAQVTTPSDFQLGTTNTTDEYLGKFPLGSVPAFEDSQGVCLHETNAIAYYVSNDTLRGNNPVDKALVLQYLEFADKEVLPSACTWVYPTLGFKNYNKQETEKAQAHIKKCLNLLNGFLESRTFLVGERVTLADIVLTCNMMMLYAQVLDVNFREPYGNVTRWFTTCINQPQFKQIIPSFTMCEKMAVFDNKRYQELHPKKGKEPKPKQEKKETKKETKKEEKPAPAAEAPKKKVDHFADVPESAWNMEDWKRFYSNNAKYEDEGGDFEAVKTYLWEKFDPAAYSWWHAEYKYNDENTTDWMTANLVDGMISRLEGCRKHCFGQTLVLERTQGEKKHYAVTGVWLLKGQENMFQKGEDDGWYYDMEYHALRKLDPLNNAEDKECVESYLNHRCGGMKDETVCSGHELK